MQEIITSLTFNIFVKICFEHFKIYYEVINALQQLLLDVFIFLKENKTTILRIFDKIDQILSKLLLVLFLDFVFIFVFVIFLSQRKRIAKKLLNLTNFCNFFSELFFY
jgi:hypothetical protein